MLVLSRKVNESIRIDSDVEIKVVAVSGNRVKIGITAPDSVRIQRAEAGGVPAMTDAVAGRTE